MSLVPGTACHERVSGAVSLVLESLVSNSAALSVTPGNSVWPCMRTSSGLAMRLIMSNRSRLSTAAYSALRLLGATGPPNAKGAFASSVDTLLYTSGTKKFQYSSVILNTCLPYQQNVSTSPLQRDLQDLLAVPAHCQHIPTRPANRPEMLSI